MSGKSSSPSPPAASTGGTHWKTLATGLRSGPFRLEDGTAGCRVEPSGSARHLESHEVTVPAGTTAPTRIQDFIDSHPEVDRQEGSVDIGITSTVGHTTIRPQAVEPARSTSGSMATESGDS